MAANPRAVLYEIVLKEHPITLRGVFYRAVSAGLYPSTAEKYYDICGREIQSMRRDKKVLSPVLYDLSYDWIVDSSRSREGSDGYSSLDRYIDDISPRYGRNYWLDQPKHVEVITEKDAMATILRPVISRWNVRFTVFRGHTPLILCVTDILDWSNESPIIPVLRNDYAKDLMLWVPQELRGKLDKAWNDNWERVNAWRK